MTTANSIAVTTPTSTLASLRSCVTEFNPDKTFGEEESSDNVEKKWEKWLENFEVCLDFEGVVDDSTTTTSKKRAALLAVGGPKLREIFKTLTIQDNDSSYDAAKTAMNTYFKARKNLTAERFKFFCTKPESQDETHDHYITRLRTRAVDCEFDKMNMEEAIKLNVILHTHSAKLQRDAIAQDMDLKKLVETARSIEMTNRDIEFMKQNRIDSGVNSREVTSVDKLTKFDRKKIERKKCWNCGGPYPHKDTCKAKNVVCHNCKKNGHFARFCRGAGANRGREVNLVQKESTDSDNEYVFDMDKLSVDMIDKIEESKYPSTFVTVRVNGQKMLFQVDSGAEGNVISEVVFEQLIEKPKLKQSSAMLRPFNSKPLRVVGEFEANITANGRETRTKIFVVNGIGIKSLMSRYTAFDLSILSISVDQLVRDMQDFHEEGQRTKGVKHPELAGSNTYRAQHLSYDEIAKLVTPLKVSEERLEEIKARGVSDNQIVEEIIGLFPETFKGIGCHKYRQVTIDVDPTVEPKPQKQRRIPFPRRDPLTQMVRELEKADIIEDVDGPTSWISNVVLTPKPKNPKELRMSIDMTTANKAVLRTRHIIPTTEELRYQLNGAKFFSKLDMKSGYMQLELKRVSRNITCFYTPNGLKRFKRLNFGTSSAAEIFHQEIMETIRGIPGVMNIYDDVLVFGATEHDHHLSFLRLLQRFKDCGLTFNLDKCEFFKRTIEFFGYQFTDQGMGPTRSKVEALRKAASPTSAAEVRSFLGMCNFSSHFIRGYSEITAPLRNLTRKSAKFEWTKDCETAMKTLKEKLSSEVVMAYFVPDRKTKLIVDGSKKDGLGCILAQLDPVDNRYKVVKYDSRPTTPAETRYPQIDIESAAIAFGCEANRMYLYGLPNFEVSTDHRPLVPLYNEYKPELPLRILSHKMRLQGYNFTVVYEPGKNNPADYLSRHPVEYSAGLNVNKCEIAIEAVVRHDLPDAVTLEELVKATEKDNQLEVLKKCIERGCVESSEKLTVREYAQVFKELSCGRGVVLRGDKIVIPQSLRGKIVSLAHEGHQGEVKTKQLIRASMWFPGIDRLVKAAVDQCLPCQAVVDTKQAEPLKTSEMPEGPWLRLNTDMFGPLPSGEYIIAVQCQYSRFPVIETVKSTSAKCIIPVLDKIFSSYGIPESLGTDNGSPFNSEEFRKFAKYLGFEHKKKIPLAPWANGMIERFNKSLGKLVRTAQVEGMNWKQELQKFLRAYRSTPHSMTGMTPAELMFNGRLYKTRLPATQRRRYLVKKREACKNDAKNKQTMTNYADARVYVKPLDIKVGDKVLCRQDKVNKLSTPFRAKPMQVTRVKGSLVEAENEERKICRHITFFKKLREACSREEEDFEVERKDKEGDEQECRGLEEQGGQEQAEAREEEIGENVEVDNREGARRSNRQCRRPGKFEDYETDFRGRGEEM